MAKKSLSSVIILFISRMVKRNNRLSLLLHFVPFFMGKTEGKVDLGIIRSYDINCCNSALQSNFVGYANGFANPLNTSFPFSVFQVDHIFLHNINS